MMRTLVRDLYYYDREVSLLIAEKYAMSYMEALRRFLASETYAMLSDPELAMWQFAPLAIFDMWEVEQISGNPRNSLYLRGDECA